MLALLLLANSAAATECVIFVTDEYKMTVNGARIYLDDSPQPIGTTAYNAGLGSNCWVGDLDLNGSHQLSAKWARVKPNRVSYQGSTTVEFAGDAKMRITIPTHRAGSVEGRLPAEIGRGNSAEAMVFIARTFTRDPQPHGVTGDFTRRS